MKSKLSNCKKNKNCKSLSMRSLQMFCMSSMKNKYNFQWFKFNEKCSIFIFFIFVTRENLIKKSTIQTNFGNFEVVAFIFLKHLFNFQVFFHLQYGFSFYIKVALVILDDNLYWFWLLLIILVFFLLGLMLILLFLLYFYAYLVFGF